MKLYGATLSGHTHRVRLFLSLLKLPYEFVEIDMRARQNRSPEHLARNPFGEVPVLEDGELTLADSTAILVYLASRYDDSGRWLPREPVAAARVQQWLSTASGKIAYGPCAARLVTVFGAPLDHERAKDISTRLFDVLERELAGRRYVLGEHASIADVAAFSYIEHAPEGGVSLKPYPNIRSWLANVRALPGFVAMPATQAGVAPETPEAPEAA
ncbi:glutathione S-transferase family protein [Duganella sp. HH101]|uniref:glutathione S-transferase family protein n=1 Tax=Duganella sp. HH101 TaxID=1781066 RepID=UPI00087429E6|nr:glutathione S-transferase [Duganella sp. HH101]OEZ97356.1 disulfide-bond oxidoreductase YfcG [Duganella sp. HH101]